jgi:hypothetical protein
MYLRCNICNPKPFQVDASFHCLLLIDTETSSFLSIEVYWMTGADDTIALLKEPDVGFLIEKIAPIRRPLGILLELREDLVEAYGNHVCVIDFAVVHQGTCFTESSYPGTVLAICFSFFCHMIPGSWIR